MLLLGMILLATLLDMIGVASIIPFMAVAANPELINTNATLTVIYNAFNFKDQQQFLFSLGILFFVLLITSLVFKALTAYTQVRFVRMLEYSIGKRLIENFLFQPYVWFLDRHSAELGKTILSEVEAVIGGGMMPFMVLITQSILVVAMLALLLIVDPLLALTVGLVIGFVYGLIFILMSKFLSRIGAERVLANQERFIVVNEAFSSPKEVKLGGLEWGYIKRFSRPSLTYAQHQASAQVIAQLPRFMLEAIIFGGMLLLVLVLMSRNGGIVNALPVISLYALAGYRLMPALQQIYASLAQLRFVGPALDILHADLITLKPNEQKHSLDTDMLLSEDITLNNICFTYPKSTQPVLNGIGLSIPVRSTIGFVGATGSGKTTMIDLILGLLEPQRGTMAVDGCLIDDSNRRQWQRTIGYVPQQIFLSDDSVAANVAFGVPPDEIDQSAVEHAAKIANLHEFVVVEMPEGYDTTVGERGVRLSGGQRQRIGIARALYHKPQILILDEATSALDNLTEQAVMEAVNNLGNEITIILIAHRLSTVRQCDQIYLLEQGQIKAHGSYEELIQADSDFRAMAFCEGR